MVKIESCVVLARLVGCRFRKEGCKKLAHILQIEILHPFASKLIFNSEICHECDIINCYSIC